jgi:hypothetical protein
MSLLTTHWGKSNTIFTLIGPDKVARRHELLADVERGSPSGPLTTKRLMSYLLYADELRPGDIIYWSSRVQAQRRGIDDVYLKNLCIIGIVTSRADVADGSFVEEADMAFILWSGITQEPVTMR